MNHYYYLAASLPHLAFNHKPDIPLGEFRALCESLLSEEDWKLLLEGDYKNLEAGGLDHPFMRRWKDWEISLRNELVRTRARKKGIDGNSYLREAKEQKFEAIGPVSSFIEEESPIKGEEALDQWRWDFLEELEVGHYFDMEMLIVYHLKLQILERKFSLEEEKGKEIFIKNMEYYNNSLNAREKSYGN